MMLEANKANLLVSFESFIIKLPKEGTTSFFL